MIDKNDPRLTAFVLGELEDDQQIEIQAAIDDSSDLQNVVDEIRQTVARLGDLFDAEPASGLTTDQHELLQGEIESVGDETATSVARESVNVMPNTRGVVGRIWWIAACLAGLLIVGSAFVLNQNNQRPVAKQADELSKARAENALESAIPRANIGDSGDLSETDKFTALDIEQGQEVSEGLATQDRRTVITATSSGAPTEDPANSRISNIESGITIKSESEFNELKKLIESTVDSEAWDETDGDGEIQAYVPNLSLTVTQQQSLEVSRADSFGGGGGGFGGGREFNGDGRESGAFHEFDFQRGFLAESSTIDRGKQTLLDVAGADDVSPKVVSGRDPDSIATFSFDGTTSPKSSTNSLLNELVDQLGIDDGKRISEEEIEYLSELVATSRNKIFDAAAPNALAKELFGRQIEAATTELAILKSEKERVLRAVDNGKDSQDEMLGFLKQEHRIKSDDENQVLRYEIPVDPGLAAAETALQSARMRLGEEHPQIRALNKQSKVLQLLFDVTEAEVGNENTDSVEVVLRNFVEKADERIQDLSTKLAAIKSVADEHGNHLEQRSWRRVKATANTSRLMVGDKDELNMNGMQVNVQVDGFRARVLIDCFYYNDRDRQLEGNFKIRLPDDSSLYYFAFGQSAYDFTPEKPIAGGEFFDDDYQYVSLRPDDIRRDRDQAWTHVKESRVVPREKAAFAYSQTVKRRVDPALVEWSGAGVFNARVFPLIPHKLHRIVIGYDVNLTPTDGGWAYQLDLPEQAGECHVDLNVTDIPNVKWELALGGCDSESGEELEAKISRWESGAGVDGGKSLKRHRFDNPQWRTMRLTAIGDGTTVMRSGNDEAAPFFATRIKVDLPKEEMGGSMHALFLVDTSLSSQPDKFNVWLEMLKATLSNNRDSIKEFAVVFFNVESHFWKDGYTANTQENVKELISYCYTLGLEGATDLHGVTREVAETKWLTQDDSRPDLFLLSDGAANWGETNLRLIKREIDSANVGSVFAYQTGLTGTAIGSLRFLAGETGGAVFSVANEAEIARASKAHRNRPWRLESIEIDGASDVMTVGRTQWVYPGQSLTIVGRGGETNSNIALKLRQGDKQKTLAVMPDAEIQSEMASRLYGQVAVGQLENLGNEVFDVSAAYARHFRITGRTCSLLMLESEADYQRFDIKPKEDWFVVKSKNASQVVENTLAKSASQLADPKAQLVDWIKRLESMQGMNFTMPTALKIALEDMDVVAIDGRLQGKSYSKDRWSKAYFKTLSGSIDYDVIAKEAATRGGESADGAIKVLSNLIERNPGDWVLARDVAYSAIELDRPAPAYHLLRNVAGGRPFEGSTYLALGHCLTQLGQADMAMIYYEIALAGKFQNQGSEYDQIVSTEYRSLLRRVVNGEFKTAASSFAEARLESLEKMPGPENDLVITMMWNTDETDVDLHVTEPTGETCSYQNKQTKSGGKITSDITDGFGPEMYTLKNAPDGKFEISAKYYGGNQNRTSVPCKVYLAIYRDYGTANESVTRDTVCLKNIGDQQVLKEIKFGKGK